MKRGVALLAAVCSAVAATSAPVSAEVTVPWQVRGYVAHAFGSPPDGTRYTNSREAFVHSYEKGFRAFEVDVIRLRDGSVLLAHDDAEHRYGLPPGARFSQLTADDMRGRRFNRRYPVLFGKDLVKLMRAHPDVVVILDFKSAWPDRVAAGARLLSYSPASVRARLYPHVHSQAQLDAMRKLRGFPGFVLALYKWQKKDLWRAPGFMERNGLDTVMLKPEVYSDELRLQLISAGARWIFVHSFTAPEEIVQWRARALGVYSNGFIGP